MSEPIELEIVIATYGVPGHISFKRDVAEKFAQQYMGSLVNEHGQRVSPHSEHARYRMVSYRMEDDPTDPCKGQVIAVCQEIQRPGPQETK